MLWTVGGRPGLRRFLVSYFIAASLRCQASSVAGVTGKIFALRLRGTSQASAANHTRSAGSYRTRPASVTAQHRTFLAEHQQPSILGRRTPRQLRRVPGMSTGRRS